MMHGIILFESMGCMQVAAWHAACINLAITSPLRGRTPMPQANVDKLIKDHKVEWIDLRFADMRGVQHHVTYPKSIVEPSLFEDGKMFDGSSISGWKGINESDMCCCRTQAPRSSIRSRPIRPWC